MQKYCLVTDNSLQLPDDKVTGMGVVEVIEHKLSLGGKICDFPPANTAEMPFAPTVGNLVAPCLLPPSVSQFYERFTKLLETNRDIICITASSGLSAAYDNALLAMDQIKYSGNIHLYDSHNTSLGLGYIVQSVAKVMMTGATIERIDKIIRDKIAHSYSLLASPSLSYLHANGFVDFSQAQVTELLGLISIFSLEDGLLNPLEKVRTNQILIEFIQEFLAEFDALEMIGLIQSDQSQEKKPLHQFVKDHFPYSVFKQDSLSPFMSVLLGPQGVGVFVIESDA